MKIKQFSQSFTCLFFLMALLIDQTGLAAAHAEEEVVRGRRYKMPTLNEIPFPGVGEEEDRAFLVELNLDPDKFDSFSIEGYNINFGKGSIDLTMDGKPGKIEAYLAHIIGKNGEALRALRRPLDKKVKADDLGSQRAGRLTVAGDHLKSPDPLIFDVTSGLSFQVDGVDFSSQPMGVVCPQNPQIFIETEDGKKASVKQVEKATCNFLRFPGSLCTRDGVFFLPNKGGGQGTWLKGMVLQTHPDFAKHPFMGVMGSLGFFPPSTKTDGSDINGFHLTGAQKVTLVIGPPDAHWEYVNNSCPLEVQLEEGRMSFNAPKGTKNNYWKLVIPPVTEVAPGEAAEGHTDDAP